ncbi:MAG: methyltransferase [Nitrospirae bacterium]|nr:methyltransferase [Nitrospirota bacterium]MBF0591006.1 methyltransferase [Nitrospirota bacterium]
MDTVNISINRIAKRYHLNGLFVNLPIDKSEIRQSELDIKTKVRSNPLKWTGQFSPQLVNVLIKNYADNKTIIFDPFLGSGTTIYEAGLAGISAVGTEINPSAFLLSRLYHYINVPLNLRKQYLSDITDLLNRAYDGNGFLRPLMEENCDDAVKKKTLEILNNIKDNERTQIFEAFVILLDFFKKNKTVESVFKAWNKLFLLINGLPFSEGKVSAYHADARKTPLSNSYVDLVITSPPYINVFNYHQQYRESAELLNWDLLKVAKSEIGANRKHRGNRFLTVIQYCLDMAQTFNELLRVCTSNARVIFVIGRESQIRGIAFYNGEIVGEVAHRALGFNLILRQERVFRNRFGQDIYEDILHFVPKKKTESLTFIEQARTVAQEVLESAYLINHDEPRNEIKQALQHIEEIKPSPYLDITELREGVKTNERFSVSPR